MIDWGPRWRRTWLDWPIEAEIVLVLCPSALVAGVGALQPIQEPNCSQAVGYRWFVAELSFGWKFPAPFESRLLAAGNRGKYNGLLTRIYG